MEIYNTLTKRKEEFKPLEPGKVKMYVCGPTVYNYIHIGNARPMIVFDTVRRYMEYKGYDVNYVSNFTDVDDKIIKKANEEGVEASVISERFIKECKQDMAAMNVKPATTHPLATQEIDGMIDMISTLIEKGHAYEKNGTVYFRTASFKDYGKLSHKNLDDLQSGFRDLKVSGEEDKESPLDFVLWKPKKEGEPEIEEIPSYFDDPVVNSMFFSYLEYRKEKGKEVKGKAIGYCIDKLESLSNSPVEQVAIIKQTIQNGWTDFFPLKGKKEKVSGSNVSSWLEREKIKSTGGVFGD